MKAIIHQPYFLPWLGYFSKFPYADKIVFLDNVNFSKGFYLDRSKYISHTGETKWLSLPIGNHTNEILNTIEIGDITFLPNFIKTLHGSYSKAKFFDEEWDSIKDIIYSAFESNKKLSDLNIKLICDISDYIGLEIPKISYSSSYVTSENKTQKVIDLCKYEECNGIIMGDGSSLKTHDWKKITNSKIDVFIQNFYGRHPEYRQVRRQRIKFAKGVSIIDAILNIGKVETLEIIKSKDYTPFKLKTNE